jgi:predicted metallo-beta-lactamase superfamily hydrolase
MQEEEKRARDAAKNIEKQVANGESLTAEQLLMYVDDHHIIRNTEMRKAARVPCRT